MGNSNVLIIGSGIAAMQLSKKLRNDVNVMILTKSSISDGNSFLAQGGVAVALGKNDNPYKHYLDTMEAGRYHNNGELVLEMTKEAPHLINELFANGCLFDTDASGELLLGLEGAHQERRIVHGGGDATGKTIMEYFLQRINDNISVVENITVYELIIENNRCIGARGKFQDGTIETFYADHVVLATGGCGQVYSFTSNAETVTGDGIALAYIAGAEVADMEFIQFHPTLLFVDGKTRGLVSEAVRGAGARLVTKKRETIMDDVHPMRDLAPRHVVSQAIYDQIRQGEEVFLDIAFISNFEEYFPTVSEICKTNGVDLREQLLPVVPGCHFLMGGVKTDAYARTSIPGLYAIGEVACTGIQGANRLASNSLLEGLFFGHRLAEVIHAQTDVSQVSHEGNLKQKIDNHSLKLPTISELQKRMMDFTGIVRNHEQLKRQKDWLEGFAIEKWLEMDFAQLSKRDISRAFMLITSWLITDSALQRTESRGGHYRTDYPFEKDKEWKQKQIIQTRRKVEVGENEQTKAEITTGAILS
ncbi:L-aspartate oxidase [Cytobacillus sp. Hz8]|uniref:L-aspartate oxidase n=1 Tax=Cytobacillus sp. Hz8 TaxID=3347168 RepID=UPI0035DF2CDE